MKAKLRVGIDFDNTIICYDDLFAKAVKERNWDYLGESKAEIKANLVKADGNDFRWQELQAIVYGVLIKDAKPFPGCLEAIRALHATGEVEFFIASHKSSHSHYLKHITLIDKAWDWLEAKDLFSVIPRENIFFRPVRDEKIQVIHDLKLDLFIDDLEEVLDDPNFPEIEALHFTKDLHWDMIREHMRVLVELGPESRKSIYSVAKSPFKGLSTIKRDGNNRIFKFEDATGKSFVIKKYSALGDHSTLDVEYQALKLLAQSELPVPEAYLYDKAASLAVYEHIPASGSAAGLSTIKDNFSSFLADLSNLSQKLSPGEFAEARDSRTRISDYKKHVLRRIRDIELGCDQDERFTPVKEFLNQQLKPLLKTILERYEHSLSRFELNENADLGHNQKILSPSDFGLHNSIFAEDGTFYFIDFEYFGWDDPVKLIADFLHHAGQNIEVDCRLEILGQFLAKTQLGDDFYKRLSTVLDLVGMEWILIILNIANPEVLKRRLYANPELNLTELIKNRLENARSRAALFHTQIEANSVFLSLKSVNSHLTGIPAWQQLITSN